GAFLGEARVAAAQFRAQEQAERHGAIPERNELRFGQLPVRAAGIAGDKDGLALLWSARVPFQIFRRRDGLAVFVEAQKREIEVVAREIEIVGIAAKER